MSEEMDYITVNIGLYSRKLIDENNPGHQLPSSDEINLCEEWFKACVVPAKAMNHDEVYEEAQTFNSSAVWKHVVERWAEQKYGKRPHIYNGAFIQAAHNLGYDIETIETLSGYSTNVNVTLWLREDDWKRVRPTGFSQWLSSHNRENSPIGDLARDAVADPKWPRHADNFEEFYNLLRGTPALDVLAQAWTEYSGKQVTLSDYEDEE